MRTALKLVVGSAALAVFGGLLILPGWLLLPTYRRTALDGIVTIEDAAEACRQSGLKGWDLVAHTQQLVNQKFTWYSTRNLWDTPARAFEHGMGYCTQYNLALKQLLDRLGFDTQVVFCPRVRVLDDPDWAMGHTWVRVRMGGEERDVCAGHAENLPGRNHFVPLLPVLPGNGPIMFLTHLGVILLCGGLEWWGLLPGQSAPAWAFKRMA